MKTYLKQSRHKTGVKRFFFAMMFQKVGIALMLFFLPVLLTAQETQKKNKPTPTNPKKIDEQERSLEEEIDKGRKEYDRRFQKIKEKLSNKSEVDSMTPLQVQSLAFPLKKSMKNQYAILFIPHDIKWVKSLRDNIQAYAYAVEATRHPMYRGPAPFKKEEIIKAEALRAKIVEAMSKPPPPSKEQIDAGNRLREKLKRTEERKQETAPKKSTRKTR